MMWGRKQGLVSMSVLRGREIPPPIVETGLRVTSESLDLCETRVEPEFA